MIVSQVILILLHGPGGSEIRISPDQVTSLRSPAGPSNKAFTDEVRCMVNLVDGKYVSVIEACETVQKMLEGK